MSFYDSTNMGYFRNGNWDWDSALETYRRWLNISVFDISVYVGENIRENTKAAFRKALSIVGTTQFHKILIINTGTRMRWALSEAREIDEDRIGPEFSKPITVIGIPDGNLCNYYDKINGLLYRHMIDTLIINSWEFASANGRYKDKLLFQLRGLVEERLISVLIYSHQTKVAASDLGKPTRGSLGKLLPIAGFICSVEEDEIRTEQERVRMKASGSVEVAPASDIEVPATITLTEPVIQAESIATQEEKSKQFVSAGGKLDYIGGIAKSAKERPKSRRKKKPIQKITSYRT